MAAYVQAWEIRYADRPCDLVYDQKIALDRYSRPTATEIQTLVIVRHENGDREYLPGAIASAVKAHREGGQ